MNLDNVFQQLIEKAPKPVELTEEDSQAVITAMQGPLAAAAMSGNMEGITIHPPSRYSGESQQREWLKLVGEELFFRVGQNLCSTDQFDPVLAAYGRLTLYSGEIIEKEGSPVLHLNVMKED
jgi:hypothetical protein